MIDLLTIAIAGVGSLAFECDLDRVRHVEVDWHGPYRGTVDPRPHLAVVARLEHVGIAWGLPQ